MRKLRQVPPMDYSLCRRTVTLYHRLPGPEFSCRRIVFAGAFLDLTENRAVREGGTQLENSFLLVLPCGWQDRLRWLRPEDYDRAEERQQREHFTLAPGDRVMEGEGPELTAADWTALPAKGGCGVVKETAERSWMGRLCHIEAASGQSLGRSGLPHPRKGTMR